jgi:branched-chain amino acid transport system substrate-binding protein
MVLCGCFGLLLALQAACTPTVQAQQQAPGKAERSIELAAYWPMTGPARIAGLVNEAVLKAAVDEVNNQGGVPLAEGTRARFRYTIFDDRCKADEGLAIIPKVAAGPYLVLIGPVCSSVAEPTFGILQKHIDDPNDTGYRLPVWSDTSIAEGLAQISDWSFRNTPSENPMFVETLRWLKQKHNARTVAVAYESDFAHAVSSYRHTLNAVKELGLEIIATQKWLWLDTEMSSQVRALRDARADLWVLNVHDISGCSVAAEMARQGVRVGTTPKAVMTLTSFASPNALKNCGDLIKGWYDPHAYAPITPEAKRLQEAVLKYPNGDQLTMGNAAVWEIVMWLRDLIPQAGIGGKPETLQRDRRLLRDAIANMGARPGLLGTSIMGPTGDMAYKPWVIISTADGKTWAPVPEIALDPGPSAAAQEWVKKMAQGEVTRKQAKQATAQ